MGYQVLARKYRPQRFADVAGQDHVTRTLLNALTQNRIAHGYIFSGHRGIGKTTIARILAQALNCRREIGSVERPDPEPCGTCDSCVEIKQGNAVDVIEIDAATNRGIDEIRELRDAARYAPARDRFKIYILDEAHQITEAAFNALLKTLEEPPSHMVFMMATTEPENIPQTIRSRCQHFSFHAVKYDDILAQLRLIAGHEQVTAEDAALALLAEAGDGSMRDALSIMDQAIASSPCDENGHAMVAADQIRDLMGSVPNAIFERLLEAVAQGQSAELMEQLNVLLGAGHSPSSLARQMVRYLRNALMAKIGGDATELLQISADERARAVRTAMLFSEEDLTRNLQIVLRTFDDLNYRQEQRFHLELGLLKLVHAQRLLPLEELLSGVAAAQGTGGGGRPMGAGSAGPVRSGLSGSGAGMSGGVSGASGPKTAAPQAVASQPAATKAAPVSPFGGSGWAPLPDLKQSAARLQPSGALEPAAAPVREVAAPASVSRSSAGLSPFAPFGSAEMPAAEKSVAVAEPEIDAEVEQEIAAKAEPEMAAAAVPEFETSAISQSSSAATLDAAVTETKGVSSSFPAVAVAPWMGFAEAITEGSLARAPEPIAAPNGTAASVDAMRSAVVSALNDAGHATASQLIGAAIWVLDVSSLRIEVAGLGKKMLGITFNAAAEKIIRLELQKLGGPARFMVVPGDGPATGGGPVMAAAPLAGSIQEEALKNPLVQMAKEMFNAEVRSVVDLRVK